MAPLDSAASQHRMRRHDTAEADLPLAAASMRLRRKPGRPRTGLPARVAPDEIHNVDRGRHPRTKDVAYEAVDRLLPRLLDLKAAAAYLGVSAWTVRDLEASGTLRRVSIPLGPGRDLRKLLFDRRDLDLLVETWKSP